jgi:hypothetical protein
LHFMKLLFGRKSQVFTAELWTKFYQTSVGEFFLAICYGHFSMTTIY